jgi:hypothetical protein
MATLAELQTRKLEAELALHRLMTGIQEVEVEHGDMRTKYSSASINQLRIYIDDLQKQIEALGGASDGRKKRKMLDVSLPGTI